MSANLVYSAVAKGNSRLLAAVNEGFGEIPRENLQRIEERWLKDPLDHYYSPQSGKVNLTAVEETWLQNNPVIRLAVTTFIDPVDIVDCIVVRPSAWMGTSAGQPKRGLVLTTAAISGPADVTV